MSAAPRPSGVADTIFALSSGLPPAAIAVVRVSGPAAGDVLVRLCGRLPAPRRATLRRLRDPADRTPLDDALLLWFPAPASATGEDMAELHLHGGRAVIAAVAAALEAMPSMRAAEPGEFTRRAFVNGRLDLAAVEGLSDLLLAQTEAQRRAAFTAAGGALGREVEGWRGLLLGLAAEVEATLDFADETDVVVDRSRLLHAIGVLADEIARAVARPSADRLREGLRVVIAGPPNAGKSTLLNALSGREAAIISEQAGTTRDRIEAPVAIDGLPFILTDTAGLRATADDVGAEGVQRAEAAMREADILLWLGDDAPPVVAATTIRIHARADLPGRQYMPPAADIALSIPQYSGLDALTARLTDAAKAMLPRDGEAGVNARQRMLLRQAHLALGEVGTERDDVLIAEALRAARAALDSLIGRAGVEDMLDRLFAGFCIGK